VDTAWKEDNIYKEQKIPRTESRRFLRELPAFKVRLAEPQARFFVHAGDFYGLWIY